MKAKNILSLIIIISILLTQSTFAAPPRYEIIDLGTLGGNYSCAYAINDTGQVVGEFLTAVPPHHAFFSDSIGGMIDLGTIDDFGSSARGINNNGNVVGILFIPGGISRAFIWDSTAGMVELGAGAAWSINNKGQIAGQFPTVYDPSAHFYRSHACIWDGPNNIIDLGTLGSPCPNSTCPDYSLAYGINDAGRVVGSSSTTIGEVHAFLWDSISGMSDLGTLGGTRSESFAINNNGQIVGYSLSVDNYYSSSRAFLWDSITGMHDLGTIGADGSYAFCINDMGQIVGSAGERAVLFDPSGNGNNTDLNNLIYPNSGWILKEARSINEHGWIVGKGFNPDGEEHAYLLKPIPPRAIYVDDDAVGANDGSSWADAYNYLQDALAAVWSGDEIRVAQGIYTPDSNSADPNGSGDRTATFQLINGVTLKGGYAGTGTPDPNARDVQLYETILSGDLAGNDVDIEPNEPDDLVWDPTRSENSYHVLVADVVNSSAILNGFTVAHGNANINGFPPHDWGGGMYNTSGSPALNNCKFEENVSRREGAGIHNDNGSPVITDCMFIRNTSQHWGGGMFNFGGSPMMFNCTFEDNLAQFGGGTFNKASSVKYSDCLFKRNSVNLYGGGLYNLDGNSTLTNCEFLYNQTPWYGGGLFNNSGNLILTNCTVADNVSEFQGGGIYNLNQSLRLDNCIFWGNNALEGSQIADNVPNTTVVSFSDIQGGWLGEGAGNVDADPCFVLPGYWDTNDVWVDGDYHLLPESPCIDAGDPNYIAEPNETDLDGNPRIIGGRIDMGAYEYSPPIQADVRIVPRTINLASSGKWIAAFLRLPEDYNVADIDPNSIFLENEIEPERFWLSEDNQAAIAKFVREQVRNILSVGQIELTITGRLTDGTIFVGTDVIKVIDKAGGKSFK